MPWKQNLKTDLYQKFVITHEVHHTVTSKPASSLIGGLTRLLALSVPPRDPAAPVTAVLDLVHLGELIADASSVSTLAAHKGDEVERAQVNLEELLQAVWLNRYFRTPRTIALLEVQPGERWMEKGGGTIEGWTVGGWTAAEELQQEREKSVAEEILGQDGFGMVRGK